MHTDKQEYCAIGSVKGNIGHLDAAAGISGLIKTVLALENKQIPTSLNFRAPNPLLRLEDSPFFVNSVLRDWNASGPRRAAVSSFGLGGTNAHAILEEAPAFEPSGSSREWQILPISARNHTALQAASKDLARYFRTHPTANLADAAFTLQTGRRHFTQRAFAVANNTRGAEIVFATRDPQRLKTGTAGHKCSVAFMFPGEGSQFVNMARGLYQEEPQFRQSLDQCTHLMRPHLERDLLEIIYPAPQQASACEKLLSQTQYAEPAIFAIEYALAMLWQSWGVLPESMIGYSVGEYLAACLADVFSLEDGVKLVCARAKLLHSHTMEEAAAHFVRLFAGVKLSSPRLPFLSNVTGDWITSQQVCSPEYWAAHLRSTVRFDEGLQRLLETKPTVLLKVGPGQALSASTLQQPESANECVLLTSSPDAHAAESDLAYILNSVGTLWTHGMNIHWQQLHSGETRRRVPLPTYQFQRKLYWLPPIHQSDSPTEVRSMDSNVSKGPLAA
jgi:acyl transferase domain-containing protein